jgi:hypothetical protein
LFKQHFGLLINIGRVARHIRVLAFKGGHVAHGPRYHVRACVGKDNGIHLSLSFKKIIGALQAVILYCLDKQRSKKDGSIYH